MITVFIKKLMRFKKSYLNLQKILMIIFESNLNLSLLISINLEF